MNTVRSVYLVILAYYLPGTVGFYLINRRKDSRSLIYRKLDLKEWRAPDILDCLTIGNKNFNL